MVKVKRQNEALNVLISLNIPSQKDYKADVLSLSASSEHIEEFWVRYLLFSMSFFGFPLEVALRTVD